MYLRLVRIIRIFCHGTLVPGKACEIDHVPVAAEKFLESNICVSSLSYSFFGATSYVPQEGQYPREHEPIFREQGNKTLQIRERKHCKQIHYKGNKYGKHVGTWEHRAISQGNKDPLRDPPFSSRFAEISSTLVCHRFRFKWKHLPAVFTIVCNKTDADGFRSSQTVADHMETRLNCQSFTCFLPFG